VEFTLFVAALIVFALSLWLLAAKAGTIVGDWLMTRLSTFKPCSDLSNNEYDENSRGDNQHGKEQPADPRMSSKELPYLPSNQEKGSKTHKSDDNPTAERL